MRAGTGRQAATDVAVAGTAIQKLFSAARVRDLILAGVALILLVIVAGQSKLFVSSSSGSGNAGSVPAAAVASGADSLPAGRPIEAETLQPANASAPVVKKTSAKSTHASAKQVVIPFSTLDLSIQHQFKDATLYIWVDDKLTLTLPLHGAAQKRLVVFNGVKGVESQTMNVPAGRRLLRFRALSTDRTIDLSKTLSAEFVGGDTKSLQISFDRHNAMHLNWQ